MILRLFNKVLEKLYHDKCAIDVHYRRNPKPPFDKSRRYVVCFSLTEEELKELIIKIGDISFSKQLISAFDQLKKEVVGKPNVARDYITKNSSELVVGDVIIAEDKESRIVRIEDNSPYASPLRIYLDDGRLYYANYKGPTSEWTAVIYNK